MPIPFEDTREEEKTPVATHCDACDNEIFVGESYYHIASMDICEDCIDDFRKVGSLEQ